VVHGLAGGRTKREHDDKISGNQRDGR
jgi:hypothetical protein